MGRFRRASPTSLLIAAQLLASGCGAGHTVLVRPPRASSMSDPATCADHECAWQTAMELGIRYQAVDGDGVGVGEEVPIDDPMIFAAEGVSMEVPSGARRIRVRARCQPDELVEILGGRARPEMPTPDAERAWVRDGTSLTVFRGEASRPFPGNTPVEIVRTWPDAEGGCTRAVVRVLDIGGVALGDLTPAESAAFTRGRYFLVPRSGLSESPVPGTTLEEYARLQREDRRRAQSLEVSDDAQAAHTEAEGGRCRPERHGALRERMNAFAEGVLALSRGDDPEWWGRVHQEVLVVPASGAASVPYLPVEGGDLAAVAFSFSDVQLQVEGGISSTDAPPSLQGVVDRDPAPSAALVFRVRPGRDYRVSVRGLGCTAVALYRRN